MVGPRGYVQHKDITISSPNLIGQNISQSELCLNQRKQQVWHAPRYSLVFTKSNVTKEYTPTASASVITIIPGSGPTSSQGRDCFP